MRRSGTKLGHKAAKSPEADDDGDGQYPEALMSRDEAGGEVTSDDVGADHREDEGRGEQEMMAESGVLEAE